MVSVTSLQFIARIRLVSAISGSTDSQDLVVIVDAAAPGAVVAAPGGGTPAVVGGAREGRGGRGDSSPMWRREDTSRFPAKGRSLKEPSLTE